MDTPEVIRDYSVVMESLKVNYGTRLEGWPGRGTDLFISFPSGILIRSDLSMRCGNSSLIVSCILPGKVRAGLQV